MVVETVVSMVGKMVAPWELLMAGYWADEMVACLVAWMVAMMEDL